MMDHRDVMLPLSLRTLATRTLLLLVIASAVSCSSLPPEDGIRVVSAEKRVCNSSSPDPGYIFLLLHVFFFSPFLNHILQAVRLLARVKWITATGPFY